MKKIILTSLSVILTVFVAFSQSFTSSGLEYAESENFGDRSVNATYFITHSSSQTILSGFSVSCNSGSGHTDNSFMRVFDLVTDFAINEDIDITSIDFGIESATGFGGSQPATVNIYTLSGPFLFANLTLIASQAINVADQSLTMMNVPISASIPSGSVLVVEIFVPNGQAVGNLFWVGSNNLPETDSSYLAAADCGIPEPLPTGDIGFPDDHMVINVNADSAGPPPVPVSNWAIVLGVLLIGAFIVIRYRTRLA